MEARAEGAGAAAACARKAAARRAEVAGRRRGGATCMQRMAAEPEAAGRQAPRTCASRPEMFQPQAERARRARPGRRRAGARARACRPSPSRCSAHGAEVAQTLRAAGRRGALALREAGAACRVRGAGASRSNVVDWVLARRRSSGKPDDLRRADEPRAAADGTPATAPHRASAGARRRRSARGLPGLPTAGAPRRT